MPDRDSLSHTPADDASPARNAAPEGSPASADDRSPAQRLPGLRSPARERDVAGASTRLRATLLRPLDGWGLARAVGVVALLTAGLLAATGRMDLVAQTFFRYSAVDETAPMLALEPAAPEAPRATAFRDLVQHPDKVFRPYTAGPVLASEQAGNQARLISAFREFLDIYEMRQGEDGNFTIRVIDNRTNDVLEVFVLEDEQAAYEAKEPDAYNWGAIDQVRRTETRRLVDKYAARGIPRPAITVKWGRKHQVHQARKRDAPFIEYEMKLARYLGMSLLPTEIGTVETFNQDRLVSAVGARSRYQLMPYLLRQYDVHHYTLPTASGGRVQVAEEWHPLLVMEPAFRHVRASVNAVGHEIPGVSAYHTGPGNIYLVYRRFLTNAADYLTPQVSVMDAYMWALTEGYETVSSNSSFGPYSRGYVASAYGSLRATDDVPVDTTQTLLAEQVQLKPGAYTHLSHLLRMLGDTGELLDWGPGTESMSLYDRFRSMNPHFALPDPGEVSGVPLEGDVRLTRAVGDMPVRFFLPLGARQLLAQAETDVIDESSVRRFDHDTYPDPDQGTKTMWDRQYDDLVRAIGRFEFTHENRQRLLQLADRFEELARSTPTHYRRTQHEIIQIHRMLWLNQPWEKLARATEAALGRERAPIQPPTMLDTPSPTVVPEVSGR